MFFGNMYIFYNTSVLVIDNYADQFILYPK